MMSDLIEPNEICKPGIGQPEEKITYNCPNCSFSDKYMNPKYKTREICSFVSGGVVVVVTCNNGHVFSFWPEKEDK